MILTEQEISEITSFPWEKTVDFVRRLEASIEEKLKAQEPVAFKQFLSDAHTAAGLLRHGKKDQGLADRLGRGVINYLCHPLPPDDVVRDAARYRWLRSRERGMCSLSTVIHDDCNPPYFELKCEDELDAAIDAAREK